MSIVIDILHLAVAALLAVIGVGYERESECPPVRFEPAAHVQTVDPRAPAPATNLDARIVLAAECDSRLSRVQFPAL